MDSWETLVAGSTIASGDAWEHLQAQGGGGGGTDQIVYVVGGLEATMEDAQLSAAILNSDMTATLTDVGILSATIQEITLSGIVQAEELSGTLTETELSGVIE